jgi:large repetitive protein
MNPRIISYIPILIITLIGNYAQAQSIGTTASAVWITDCNQSNYFNTSGSAANQIGPVANAFNNANLGAHTQGSGTLILRGAQVKTFKDPVASNVCTVRMLYRVYLQSSVPGAFTSIDLPFLEDCGSGTFPSGGACQPGDQKWQRIIADGTTIPFSPVDLTNYAPGNYVLEVYYEANGSLTSTTLCNDLVTENNSGNNYKAFFSVQSPDVLISTNPLTCKGSQGSITLNGFVPGASYQIGYSADGADVAPVAFVADGSGIIVITGLKAGLYTNFTITINGCTTLISTGIILSDPIFTPTFNAIPPFCAGTANPVLPTTSNNGISGTWNPAVVDNQNSGTYTFTPTGNQCGRTRTLTVTVIPRTIPTFTFGTSLVICGTGAVPVLPNISMNGITGTWNPAVVDDQNSGVYTFTPAVGGCTSPTTFTVTVNPNITPAFSFGTSSSLCTGGAVPTLPNISDNGITGTWTPAVVDAQNSGTYTFTPTAGQCAVPITYTQTINPIIPPTFGFGTSASICMGATAPLLPVISTNGITGTWTPAVVDNMASGTYTFASTTTPCASPFTFTVTVNPIVTPTFSFGTSQSVCINATAPVLPTTSTNGITGTWSPALVDNQTTGTYTFTPTAGQCASKATLNYEVNPVPSVNKRTDTTVYDGALVPSFNFTSTGLITTWSNSNPAIGLPASGAGTVPSFKAVNMGNEPVTGTVTLVPHIHGCAGNQQTYTITVLPLAKDIFVPNVFSPNNDGRNDMLYVYGNYVDKLEMLIFNQWGQQIAAINNKSQGWDGRHKGNPQPVGVYVYVLKAVLTDGRTVTMKGSITLVR